jgi:NTE family protein
VAGRKIGLALGGGAARGVAHVGVLRGLEELGVEISVIAGTSSGSMVGALFAAGYSPEQLTELARAITWRDLTELVVPRRGLLGTERMERLLEELLGGRTFDELSMPCAAVCTDLYTAGRIILRHGPVAPAVRASCSLPGVFSPLETRDWALVDGGVVENVPVKTARELGADLVIGVDLYADIAPTHKVEGMFGVLARTFEILQRYQCRTEFQSADVCLEPRMAGASLLDLNQIDHYIQLGYEAVMEHEEDILALKERAQGET